MAGVNLRQIERTDGPGRVIVSGVGGEWRDEFLGKIVTTAYVDPITGDNSTAKMGTELLPFKDPWAVREYIEDKYPNVGEDVMFLVIWLPGEYTVGDSSENLRVIEKWQDSILFSSVNYITHYLTKGAKIIPVTNSIRVVLFNNQDKGSLIGRGSMLIERETNKAVNFGLTWYDGEYNINIELDELNEFGATENLPLITGDAKVSANLKIKKINTIGPLFDSMSKGFNLQLESELIEMENSLVEFDATESRPEYELNIKAKTVRNVGDSTGRILDINSDTITADININIDTLKNIYLLRSTNTKYKEESKVNIKIGNYRSTWGSTVEPLVEIVGPTADDDNEFRAGVLIEVGTLVSAGQFIRYTPQTGEYPTRLTVDIKDGNLEESISNLTDSQNFTISGKIKMEGDKPAFYLTEPVNSTRDNTEQRVLLKDLYVELDDGEFIDTKGFDESEILTMNVQTNETVEITTLS